MTFLHEGGSLIVEGQGRLKEFQQNTMGIYTMDDFEVYIWKRWLTHGKGPNGESMFLKYWYSKNIEDIQRDFYILKLKSLRSH